MTQHVTALRNYTRWTHIAADEALRADLVGCRHQITVKPLHGLVVLDHPAGGAAMTPDEARMIGVRLIEGAALADGDAAIRGAAPLLALAEGRLPEAVTR